MTEITTARGHELQLDQKYRPQTIKEMILPEKIKSAFLNFIKKGSVPHLLLFSSQPGTGKTSSAKALVNDLGMDPASDYLFLKGDEVNVNFIRNELVPFCSYASPSGKKRIVIIDEYDRPTLGEAHKMMRATVDEFSNDVTFIITANDPKNIHEALRDRMHQYNFGAFINEEERVKLQQECYRRLVKICEMENIEVKDDRILKLIARNHTPYYRTCLVELAKYAYANNFVLDAGIVKELVERRNTSKEVVDLIKSQRVDKAKLMAIARMESQNFGDFVSRLYFDLVNDVTDMSQEILVKIIGEMNKTVGFCGNVDFHLYYTFIQLQQGLVWK